VKNEHVVKDRFGKQIVVGLTPIPTDTSFAIELDASVPHLLLDVEGCQELVGALTAAMWRLGLATAASRKRTA